MNEQLNEVKNYIEDSPHNFNMGCWSKCIVGICIRLNGDSDKYFSKDIRFKRSDLFKYAKKNLCLHSHALLIDEQPLQIQKLYDEERYGEYIDAIWNEYQIIEDKEQKSI